MARMEILLIIPPSTFLMDERVFPSLGVLKVAASLEAAGKSVGVLDLSGIENYLDVLSLFLATFRNGYIGITATTPQMPAAHLITKRIRAVASSVRIILGGPHVTVVYAAVRKERKDNRIGRAATALQKLVDLYDVLCIGDGEAAIFEAIGTDTLKIIDADNRKGSLFQTRDQYAESPFPARHLIDLDSYHYEIEGHRATSLISQLGCPMQCGFCSGRSSPMLRIIRTRPTSIVIEEITQIYDVYGYTGFMFYDDELNINKSSFMDLLGCLTKLQTHLRIEFRLRGFIKAELFDEEQAKAMYEAGFRWILCGFEAADERILININKRATIEDNTAVVQIAHKHGLKVKALMSIGHPGETHESVLSIHDWLIVQKVDDFDVTIITPYPGSPYYDEAHEQEDGLYVYGQPTTGDRLYMREVDYTEYVDYYKGMPGEYVSLVHTNSLTEIKLVELREQVVMAVRKALRIPYNIANKATKYEHSMGQGLSDHLLRVSQSDLHYSQSNYVA